MYLACGRPAVLAFGVLGLLCLLQLLSQLPQLTVNVGDMLRGSAILCDVADSPALVACS